MKQAKYLTLETKNNKYLFDGVLSRIILYSQAREFIIKNFSHYDKGEMMALLELKYGRRNQKNFAIDYHLIRNMILDGAFFGHSYQQFLTPEKLQMEALKSPISQLFLSLTEPCKMLCKHGSYSDKYPFPLEKNFQAMSWEVAKRALNHYFYLHEQKEERGLLKPPSIYFLSSTSLLSHFSLIQAVLAYAFSVRKDTRFYLRITDALLTQDMMSILVQYNVYISFNLHDPHIQTKSLRNKHPDKMIRKIKEFQLLKQKRGIRQLISFNCDFWEAIPFHQLLTFFIDHYELFDPFIFTSIPENRYESYFDWVEGQIDRGIFKLQDLNSKEALIHLRDFVCGNDFSFKEGITFLSLAGKIVKKEWLQGNHPPSFIRRFNNASFPLNRLIVHPNGSYSLSPTMKTTFPIGNVREGINYKQLTFLANRFLKEQNQKCYRCPIASLCQVSFNSLDEQLYIPSQVCKDQIQAVYNTLENYLQFKEDHPKKENQHVKGVQYQHV